jgi:glutamate synthase (NADPH), homotetrameric
MLEVFPNIRNKNFEEVALGYSEADAVNEAQRCLGCKNKPCVAGCPVSVKIPEFIAEVANGEFEAAYKIIKETNSLPAVCGRVCPQETQCEGKCVRAKNGESVAIGRLERFCADYHMKNSKEDIKLTEFTADAKKIAVVGSGPASLSCAGDLIKMGYKVTIFEAFHTAGGVLVYGIPEFRLPKAIVKKEIETLEKLGVQIELNTVVGRTVSVDELFEDGYAAAFIGSGAGLPGFLGIPGESSCGVYSANEYLTRINLMKAYMQDHDTPVKASRNTAVVGGGNVAMDAARCAKRLGAENVYIVYRRSEAEMPARHEEAQNAHEEGINFMILSNPTAIIADDGGNVIAMECEKMKLEDADASGRRRVSPIPDSAFTIEIDTAIMAVGTSPNPLIRMTTPGLEANKYGCLETSDGVTTTREGIFAGGDAVTGAATVILAMGAGKEAAAKIDEYVKSKQ